MPPLRAQTAVIGMDAMTTRKVIASELNSLPTMISAGVSRVVNSRSKEWFSRSWVMVVETKAGMIRMISARLRLRKTVKISLLLISEKTPVRGQSRCNTAAREPTSSTVRASVLRQRV